MPNLRPVSTVFNVQGVQGSDCGQFLPNVYGNISHPDARHAHYQKRRPHCISCLGNRACRAGCSDCAASRWSLRLSPTAFWSFSSSFVDSAAARLVQSSLVQSSLARARGIFGTPNPHVLLGKGHQIARFRLRLGIQGAKNPPVPDLAGPALVRTRTDPMNINISSAIVLEPTPQNIGSTRHQNPSMEGRAAAVSTQLNQRIGVHGGVGLEVTRACVVAVRIAAKMDLEGAWW